MMKKMTLSKLLMTAVVGGLAGTVTVSALAAKTTETTKTDRGTYAYVSTVFDRLQSHWEKQAFEQRLNANSLLTFILNEDGTLAATNLEVGANGRESGQALVDYLKANAPFSDIPSQLKGRQLEFKVKMTPGSLQMLGYQLVEKEQKNPVITYAAPISPQPVSLFYARALPVTPGKVWEKADGMTSDEQAMSQYVAQVQEQIRQNWRLSNEYKFQRVVAMLMIDRDGTLLGAHLKQSSGDKLVDKAALNAIYTAGAFPTAPKNVPSLPVMIEYVFDPVLVQEQ